MPQFTQAVADRMPSAQANELVRVLDLQSRWENLRVANSREAPNYSVKTLRERQVAFDAYRAGQLAYAGRYRGDHLPEVARSSSDRVAAWCRIVSAVLRRAAPEYGAGYPAHVVAKVVALAGRLAERAKVSPPELSDAASTVAAAVRTLDEVAGWCDRLTGDEPPAGAA